MNKSFSDKLLYHIQRNSNNVYLRNCLSFFVGLFLPSTKRKILGTNIIESKKTEEQILDDLIKNGFSDLGVAISEELVSKLYKDLESLPCYKFDKKQGVLVNFEKLEESDQLGNFDRADLSQIQEILSLANDEKILNIVAKYLGAKPTLSNINCWWSFAKKEAPKEAQFFHRDVDDYKFLKLFIYLTDVNVNSGPHVYVKGSHKLNKLAQIKRFSDEEVISKFSKENVVFFDRPKGSCFIVDTYGVHKGLLPIDNNRLLMQVQYSLLPLISENYSPVVLENNNLKLDSYVNRLFVKNN